MRLFADSRVKYIDLSEYIKITDSFLIQSNYSDNTFYYMTESFAIISVYRVVLVNFGMDVQDRFDHFVIAPRDGKTEYEAINKKIAILKDLIEKNPDSNKYKNKLRKYKKIIKGIPEYKPFSPAGSDDCFAESLKNANYQTKTEFAKKYVVLDVETNGLSKKKDDLLSISIYDPYLGICYNRFLPLDMQPSVSTTHINGISDNDLKGKKHINKEEAKKIIEYFDLRNRTILVYGPDDFDSLFLQNYFSRHGISGFENLKFENIKRHVPSGLFELSGSASKDNMCKIFGIAGVESIHTGMNDCVLEWKLYEKFIECKPIRIGNNYYKFNESYIVPVSVLLQNPKIYQYAGIPVRYVLGSVKQIFHHEVSKKALRKIKKFDTNITGISIENIIYSSLGAVKQDNSSFLINNKSKLEKIATIETRINEIAIRLADDGLLEAVEEKDREFINEVNNVALVLKKELKTTIEFIKENIFGNKKIMSQELVLSENAKVLALCDLSNESAVMEIKTIGPSIDNLGYLNPRITYQFFYQSKKREMYYLHIFILGGYKESDGPDMCNIDISKIELNEYNKEDYEKMVSKLTTQEELFLEYIRKHPNCQYKDLEQSFPQFSRKMIEKRIKSLEAKKHINRIGSKKYYHWEIIENN